MALFNPAPLLLNPRFATPGGFTLRRSVVIVDDDGISTRTFTDTTVQGVVVPSGSLGMKRTSESEQQGDNITIYTMETLTLGDADAGVPADEVIWHGQVYQVTKQDDYTDFGFNVAEAELVEPGGRSAS